MRQIKEIIIHCTATEAGQEVSVAEIDKWHTAKGWDGCGYHFIIHLDGRISYGRPVTKVGAHCKGHNRGSIGIAYVGGLKDGVPTDTRTVEQFRAMLQLCSDLVDMYPNIVAIHGHNYYNPKKACPCFNVSGLAIALGR